VLRCVFVLSPPPIPDILRISFLQVELTALREVKAQLERDLKIQKDMVVEKVCLFIYLFIYLLSIPSFFPCLSLILTLLLFSLWRRKKPTRSWRISRPR